MNGIAVTVFVAVVGIGSPSAAQVDPPPTVATETLVISYQPQEELPLPLIIDELDPQTVLTIHASGFDANTTGRIRQCVRGSTRQCRNDLKIRFNDRGAATFQYFITDDFSTTAAAGAEPCRLREERCTIELGAAGKLTVVDTVFVDQAPQPGRLFVTPSAGLLVGDTIMVTASHFRPGTELTLMICAAPSTSGPRCGAPGPELPLTIASNGTARAEVAVNASAVGVDRVACGRRVTCHLVVASEQRDVRARPVALAFAVSPGADYAITRVIIGLAGALALALLAGWLIQSTDWNPPRESDSTLIDEADYADLDLEAALFDEHSLAP
ncbi:MAG: hypothetical protein HKN91_02730 [Acidimicrobiia bacterium]|nr:hypothetical protein [Acidimicrobiia bacterium]